MTTGIVILGSGMAGLGAAHRLRAVNQPAVIFEKSPYSGGHTASHARNGFIFDEGPHVSFTKVEKVRNLFAEAVGGKYEVINAYIDNYWRGHWLRHPVATNMHGMPAPVVVDIIRDYVEAKQVASPTINNYEDWLVASYGRTYAELFPMQYARKYHTTEARNMTTDWVGPRLYQAKLDEILTGALSANSPNIHYVQDYRYPTEGGFVAFLSGLVGKSDIQLNHEVTAINPKSREIRFASGSRHTYTQLISSIPLPDLIPMIAGAPQDVRDAANALACTSVVLVNLGIDRPDVSRSSWNYYYDDEFPFSRVSYPRNYSPKVVPEGTSSIQAEVYFSKKYKPVTGRPEDCIQPTIDGLRKAGVILPGDKILHQEAMLIPYANVIFDLDRPAAVAKVHGYLEDVGIRWCGRFGDWGYLWSDEAFLSGEGAAQKVVDSL